MLIRQPSVIDLKYYHSFPASQTWYTASSHHYPEGCLEFFGNFEFRLKYRISAFEKKKLRIIHRVYTYQTTFGH